MAVIDDGPEVTLRNWFERPYDDAIAAARTCYSPRVVLADEITDRQRKSIGPLTYAGGHHTVYQHATFEFGLAGVSRQLAWCFLNNFPFYNTEQQSQRYVRLDEVRAVVPPEVKGEARAVFEAAIERAWEGYAELTRRLEPVTHGVLAGLWRLKDRQSRAFGKNVRREAEKKAIETARYVIPLASHTAMVYTVSGLTLHRLRRMAAACDAPSEARRVVDLMIAAVERVDPEFISEVGDPPLDVEDTVEAQAAPPGPGDPALLEGFDKSLGPYVARLVDWSARGPESVAAAVRHVLGRADLDDEEALELALDPAKNRYRLETMNVSFHAPLMRTLDHAHYTFRKKLSHTADSQDQRHRMVPGSRPLLTRTVPDRPDVPDEHRVHLPHLLDLLHRRLPDLALRVQAGAHRPLVLEVEERAGLLEAHRERIGQHVERDLGAHAVPEQRRARLPLRGDRILEQRVARRVIANQLRLDHVGRARHRAREQRPRTGHGAVALVL